MTRIVRTAEQLDFVGLVLLGGAVALILLPLTLAEDAKDHWKNREQFSPDLQTFLISAILSFYDCYACRGHSLIILIHCLGPSGRF